MKTLTDEILEEHGFKNVGQCQFRFFDTMNYWVKNGVCLFYNTPVKKDYQEKYLVGYAEMRQGNYVAVAFRWIGSFEELKLIYESISNKSIKDAI